MRNLSAGEIFFNSLHRERFIHLLQNKAKHNPNICFKNVGLPKKKQKKKKKKTSLSSVSEQQPTATFVSCFFSQNPFVGRLRDNKFEFSKAGENPAGITFLERGICEFYFMTKKLDFFPWKEVLVAVEPKKPEFSATQIFWLCFMEIFFDRIGFGRPECCRNFRIIFGRFFSRASETTQ